MSEETTGYRSKNKKQKKHIKQQRKHEKQQKNINRIVFFAGLVVLAATIAVGAVLINPAEADDNAAYLPSASPSAAASASAAAAAATPSVSGTAPSVEPSAAAEKTETEVEVQNPAQAPLLYENRGQLFLASGGERVSIQKRGELENYYGGISSMLSGDNSCFYYLSGIDRTTGAGTLMAVPSNAESAPAALAESVCAACVSYDGRNVMYVSGMEGTSGTLFLLSGGEAREIAQHVVPVYFKFSIGGGAISYVVQESGEAFALYVKTAGGEPRRVTTITAQAVIDNGISVTRFNDAVPFDNGDIVYSVDENNNMPVYYYSGNQTERICNDGYIVKTFAQGDFLYAQTGQEARPLWYKAPGNQAVLISENYDYIKFPVEESVNRGAFLLVEHIGEGADNPGVMMYEIDASMQKHAISLADNELFEANRSLDCVSYQRDSKLYVSRKTEAGWKEVFLANASAQDFQGASASGMIAGFDASGSNLYYFDEYDIGPLYRYSVADGSTEAVANSVDWMCIAGDTPYAHTVDDKLYRLTDGAMVCEGVREARATQGGVYLLTGDGKVCYAADGGKARAVDSYSSSSLTPDGFISFYPPLEQDVRGALSVLADEVDYCLYKLGVFRDEYPQALGAGEAAALCAALLERADTGEAERVVLEKLRAGFEAYVRWKDGKAKRAEASSVLEQAAESYSYYLAGALETEQ